LKAPPPERSRNVLKEGVTGEESRKAQNQLRARLVFENDSVTNLGHQLGFYETVATVEIYRHAPHAIAAVTKRRRRPGGAEISAIRSPTVGWFNPRNSEVA